MKFKKIFAGFMIGAMLATSFSSVTMAYKPEALKRVVSYAKKSDKTLYIVTQYLPEMIFGWMVNHEAHILPTPFRLSEHEKSISDFLMCEKKDFPNLLDYRNDVEALSDLQNLVREAKDELQRDQGEIGKKARMSSSEWSKAISSGKLKE